MATDVDQSCYRWSRDELDDQDDSREISISQMLDHGSISFGRFALEPLSWEKRSVFTHNRYQEELEKFKAPGIVAQKKAYFEDYYKRIRAMKALQENKHSESASNFGGCCGISGQIREDQSVVPSKSDRNEMISTIGPGLEKASTELTFTVDAVGETALVKLDSPAKFSKDNKNGESPPNLKHCQILDLYSYHDEPITTCIAHGEQHDFGRVDNKLEARGMISESISRQTGVENQRFIGRKSHGDVLVHIICSDREKASIEVPSGIDVDTVLLETDPPIKSSEDNKMGENFQNSKQFQFLDQNSYDHELITACIQDRKQHDFISQDNEEISQKTEKFVPNDSLYSSSSPKVLEDMLKLNAEQNKVNHDANKGFKGNAFSSEVMEHSSTAGDLVRSELKTKSITVMLTQVLRDSSQKRNGKNNVCIVSSQKQSVDRILSNRHATVASHGSNKEMHSKVTTPRLSVFATGKQAVTSVSSSARYDTKNMSSLSLPPMNINSKGVSSRSGIPYIQKREKLENKREHEPRRQPLVTNRQLTHLKGVSASNVIRPLKARSVNLPTSCKGDSNVGINSNRITRNNEDGKQKLVGVANDERCLKEVRAHGKSSVFHVPSGNQNPDKMKMAPSRIRDLSVSTKISHLGDNPLDKKKPRLEKPRWR